MDDDRMIQNLLFAERGFPAALSGGVQMLVPYNRTWSTLLDSLRMASKTGNVGQETLSLVHSVASRIAHLSSCFLEMRRWEEFSTASLQRDWDTMFHQMAALDLDAKLNSVQPANRNDTHSDPHSNTPIPKAKSPPPLLLTPAYDWLLVNLHNPYPTMEIKTQIAATSSCQVSSINSWFANARRRIGWTTLCRERFCNCRVDMIDAAFRALVKEDPQRPLSPELRHAFIAIKVAAENLYPSTFNQGVFAGNLDVMVKDVVERDRESVGVGECHRVESRSFTKVARDLYPSPDRSITASPVVLTLAHSLTDESEEEVVVPPILTGSKRRRASIEPVDQPPARRPVKRLRTSVASQSCLPSPPSSTNGIDMSLDDGLPEPSLVPVTETNEVTPSGKQRLSDVNATTTIPNRPCGSAAAPHIHTVPDPLPRSNVENEHIIDDWFDSHFDTLFAIPPPVDATEPDFTTPWEVELFKDYSIPGNPRCTHVATTDTHSSTTDLSDLDTLLQSIGGDTFTPPSESVLPSDMTGTPYTASLSSSTCDFSQTSIDWATLLDVADTNEPLIGSTFFHPADSQVLPEIDLSVLQLPYVAPVMKSQSGLTSKQAKLQQLHAMQEAVRLMEQELQSEGVVI